MVVIQYHRLAIILYVTTRRAAQLAFEIGHKTADLSPNRKSLVDRPL
jgi:hypothetical protein